MAVGLTESDSSRRAGWGWTQRWPCQRPRCICWEAGSEILCSAFWKCHDGNLRSLMSYGAKQNKMINKINKKDLLNYWPNVKAEKMDQLPFLTSSMKENQIRCTVWIGCPFKMRNIMLRYTHYLPVSYTHLYAKKNVLTYLIIYFLN